jgi:predicted transcriptional regulator
MAITRSQIARQLLAEGGVSLDDAKRMAPEGEFLAYINPKEAQMLKDAGGSGIMTPMGIPSFVDFGGSGTGYGSAADTFSAASGNPGADSRSNFGGDGGGNDPIQDQIQSRPAPKKSFFETVSDVGKNIAGLSVFGPAYAGFQLAKKINPDFLKFDPNAKPPVTPPGGDDNETQVAQPVMPIMPLVPKLPSDIEPEQSDMAEFVQRFNLPEQFRLAEGGEVRQEYGLGKLVRKITKPIKKIVKSDIGKAALAGAAIYGLGGGTFFGRALPGISTSGGFAFRNIAPNLFGVKGVGELGGSKGILGSLKLTKGFGAKMPTALGAIVGATGLGAAAAAGQEEEVDSIASRIADETGIDIAQIRKEVQEAYAKGDISGLQSKYPFLIPTSAAMADGGIARLGYAEGTNEAMQKQAEEAMKEGFPRYTDEDGNEVSLEEFLKAAAEEDKKMVMPKRKPPKEVQKRKEKNFKKAKPALEKESADMVEDLIRSKKAGGGLMDLGGNEMDLRGGGFVPIGAKEKADDVPARLSKNEFVFTADAVRAAGGGSVEKGAQKMYNTMKQLEDSIA